MSGSAGTLLALLGGMMLLGSSASAQAPKPKPKPALPKPIGTPPTTAPTAPARVVPASPPKGGAVPGSTPKGAVAPGTKPKAVAKAQPRPDYLFPLEEKQNFTSATPPPDPSGTPRADYLFPVDYPADFTPVHPNPPPKAAPAKAAPAKAAPKAKPASSPLGVAFKQGLMTSVAPTSPASVRASPELEPNRGSPPAGYNPATAKARARALAAHLAKKGPAGYSRPEMKSWQTQAGLRADGLYGGSSRGALIYFGVPDPPRPFSAPVATLPYVPPTQR